jgi:hypothetical protein
MKAILEKAIKRDSLYEFLSVDKYFYFETSTQTGEVRSFQFSFHFVFGLVVYFSSLFLSLLICQGIEELIAEIIKIHRAAKAK